MTSIDDYLAELARLLPLTRRRRILAEVEGHLREAAEQCGEREALRRFGSPDDVARGFRAGSALAAARLAALAVVALVAFPFVSYPVVEHALPPAPWISEDAIPPHLAWKRDAVVALLVVAIGSSVAVVLALRRSRMLVAAVGAALVPLTAGAILNALLSVQWASAVPGTRAWLHAVWGVHLLVLASAVALTARALALERR